MTSFDSLSSNQKIRAALHRDVRTIATETCHFLGLEITKPAMEIVAELVYKKLAVYGADLEAFAKHAKRATINSDDVKLLVRRCPSLKSHLNIVAPSPKEKRRKTTSKAPETPASKQKASEATTSKLAPDPDTSTLRQKAPEPSTLKQKAPDNSTLKQKEPETSTSKQRDPENEDSKEKDKRDERTEIDRMVIDDMIDLTFD